MVPPALVPEFSRAAGLLSPAQRPDGHGRARANLPLVVAPHGQSEWLASLTPIHANSRKFSKKFFRFLTYTIALTLSLTMVLALALSVVLYGPVR